MSLTFDQKLSHYADLAVRIGLDLRPGQRLGIVAPVSAAPLVRLVTEKAYQAGSPYVSVFWEDDAMNLARFKYAPRNSFGYYPEWKAKALEELGTRGEPLLMIRATDPNLLANEDPTLVAEAQKAQRAAWRPYDELRLGDASAWCIMVAPLDAWNDKVLAHLPATQREAQMWEVLFRTTRADQPDVVAAWKSHLEKLERWSHHLNERQYKALRFTGPGTDLEIGLPSNHRWKSGASVTRHGIRYVANIPTEEVFTMPHRERVEGTVSSTKPLNYAGRLIDGIRVRFQAGRIVEATAAQGEETLHKLLETDEGARHLGEVALVPHSSPISQSGLTFYHTLFDENAASHIAVGKAYRDCIQGGLTMTPEELLAAGANDSLTHVDWMIGSGEVQVDGLLENGASEPVMRDGEWTF